MTQEDFYQKICPVADATCPLRWHRRAGVESKRGYGEDISRQVALPGAVRWEGRAARNVMLRPRGSSGTQTSPLS
jgi:hypothetical protein